MLRHITSFLKLFDIIKNYNMLTFDNLPYGRNVNKWLYTDVTT